jgi:hypothetical protein
MDWRGHQPRTKVANFYYLSSQVTLALRCLTLARAKFWITNPIHPTQPLPRPLGRGLKDNRYSGGFSQNLALQVGFCVIYCWCRYAKMPTTCNEWIGEDTNHGQIDKFLIFKTYFSIS